MATKRPREAYDPAFCRHGVWPSSQLVDGRFEEYASRLFVALERHCYQLADAERAAATGQGHDEPLRPAAGGTSVSVVESRLRMRTTTVELADDEARRLRSDRQRLLSLLKATAETAEAVVGLRGWPKGRRDRYGRPLILTSNQEGGQST
jgi:hypothetical protein